jgi:1-pyrroline-5-carboxylate dehydrogenase
MTEKQKITYTTIGSSEEFHQDFEKAVEEVKKDFGKTYPNMIGGVPSPTDRKQEIRSPIDRRILIGYAQLGTKEEANKAVDLAHKAFPAWRDLGWRERVRILRGAADWISDHKYYLAALMSFEAGKNRLESMGEVEESADLIRYYCANMEENHGYVKPMDRISPEEKTSSVLVPYGVWAVISPFNFPLALSTGMLTGVLVTGNAAVLKPAHDTPIIGYYLYKAMREGGVPADAVHFIAGSGSEVGATITENPHTQGVAFTGSYEVGMKIYKNFSSKYPKPVVVEMGGKNPVYIGKSADIEAATDGVMRSAFGFGGQKCSATSRVYINQQVKDQFVSKLLDKTKAIKIGNPILREVFLGPVINEAAYKNYEDYIRRIKETGGEILHGGIVRKDGDYGQGYYVEPTIAYMKNRDHELFYEEMFLPILLITEVNDLEEALKLSNKAIYGLTAGIFSNDAAEVRKFLDGIESGVTYVNRRGGATTGAWPGVNPFGGWKASGSTGPSALGPYYLLKFLREQSRTVVGVDV